MVHTLIGGAESEYQAVRDFIVRKTGLYFQENKREDLLAVLQDRLDVLRRFDGLGAYLAFLQREEDGGRELRGLVSRLTVGETYFFRNRGQFDALRDQILPEIIKRRRGKNQGLRIWSAGCSTGEEPFSVAILLREILPDIGDWDIHLLATDIDEDALAVAREGVFRNWSFREVEERYRQNYFTPEGKNSRIRPEVQSMVTFAYLNLADDHYPSIESGTDDLDLILCRNVMIYFPPELCREVTRRFFECLEDQGSLLVGHSEHSELIHPGFSRCFNDRAIVYRKSGPNPVWEKAIALRFRGSGPPPPGILTHEIPGNRREGVQRPPGTEETLLFEHGVLLVGQMRPLEAIAEFRRVLALNPCNERALYAVAMLLANTGDTAAATEFAERLVETNPLHLEATYLLAILARETGGLDRELALLKKTVYLNPDFVLGHFQIGLHYLKSGNAQLAQRSLLNALRILDGRAIGDPIDGVDGMTVGRLRQTVLAMIPAGPAGEKK
ncbi:MAG: CheR family methyltransferase [Candidatus Methylomirabilia bacterium]